MSAGLHVRLQGRLGALVYDLEFSVDKQPVVLIGPNGAGKTTVLRTIAGGSTGLQGAITLADRTLMDTERGILCPPEHRRIGYVPQSQGLFPHLTVLDNVAFGCGSDPQGRQRARAQLAELDVEHLADRRPRSLSGGEGQRVALARALAMQPEALLLDEPLGALDVGQRRRTRQRLATHLRRAKRPTLVVTHDLRDALALDAQVVVMEAGRIVDRGSIEALQAEPTNDFVSEFFGPLAPARDV